MLTFDLGSIFHNVLLHNLSISCEKGSQILLPGAGHGLKTQVKKDIQQLAHASIFTRLILILGVANGKIRDSPRRRDPS